LVPVTYRHLATPSVQSAAPLDAAEGHALALDNVRSHGLL